MVQERVELPWNSWNRQASAVSRIDAVNWKMKRLSFCLEHASESARANRTCAGMSQTCGLLAMRLGDERKVSR